MLCKFSSTVRESWPCHCDRDGKCKGFHSHCLNHERWNLLFHPRKMTGGKVSNPTILAVATSNRLAVGRQNAVLQLGHIFKKVFPKPHECVGSFKEQHDESECQRVALCSPCGPATYVVVPLVSELTDNLTPRPPVTEQNPSSTDKGQYTKENHRR